MYNTSTWYIKGYKCYGKRGQLCPQGMSSPEPVPWPQEQDIFCLQKLEPGWWLEPFCPVPTMRRVPKAGLYLCPQSLLRLRSPGAFTAGPQGSKDEESTPAKGGSILQGHRHGCLGRSGEGQLQLLWGSQGPVLSGTGWPLCRPCCPLSAPQVSIPPKCHTCQP
jgi:hypothetical protein